MSPRVLAAALPLALALAGCPDKTPTEPPESAATRTPGTNTAGAQRRMQALVEWPDVQRPPASIAVDGKRDAALIVAIEGYDYVPAVPGAVNNGKAWHAFLTDGLGVPASQVRLLTNASATKAEIERALDKAAAQAQEGGRVWFVFIGHGAPASSGDDGYLLGSSVRQTTAGIRDGSVQRSDVIDRLETSAAQPVAIFDACFSGRSGGGDALVPDAQPVVVTNLSAPKRAVVLTAAAGDQYAGGLPGASRPAFSYLLLGALRGWADDGDGRITADKAVTYARQAIATVVEGREQTPGIDGPGDVVLTNAAREAGPNLGEIARTMAEGMQTLNGDGLVLTELPTLDLPALTQGEATKGQPEVRGDVDLGSLDPAKLAALEAEHQAQKQKAKDDQAAREAAEKEAKEARRRLEAAIKTANDAVVAARPGTRANDGEAVRDAWCAIAGLPDPNPYRAQAEDACSKARTYVEQRRRLVLAMHADWNDKILPALGYEVLSIHDKERLCRSFVDAYGILSEQRPVAMARRAVEALGKGALPEWLGRSPAETAERFEREHWPIDGGPAGEFVSVPGGEWSVRKVERYELGRSEVTVAQYRACVEAGRCDRPVLSKTGPEEREAKPLMIAECNWWHSGRDAHPINCVGLAQAKQYCAWVGARLPKNDEWQWAYRDLSGPRTGRYLQDPTCDDEIVNNGCGAGGTWPIGSRPKGDSRHGIQDLNGNVSEWSIVDNGYAEGAGNSWASMLTKRRRPPRSLRHFSQIYGIRCARTPG